MFTSLYVKTNYSLLSSFVSIDKLIDFLKKHNISSIGICDDDLNSTMEFYTECVSNNIKPIIGLDIKYREFNLLLYAKDYEGYKSLIKLSTLISEKVISLDDLKKWNNNVIMILPYDSISLLKELDFYEDFYIGVLNKNEETNVINNKLNPVFINKVLYLDKNYEKYMKYLYMIKESKTILDDINFKDNYNYFLTDVSFMVKDISIKNTNVIADKCNLVLEKKDDLLPIYDENINGDEYLTNLSIKGLIKRCNGNIPDFYKKRLKYELDIIIKMGFSNYFLIVYDFIKYSKKNNILVGPGRGSAAGSLVAYSLGITDVDPIKYNLLFERFLNPERVTMPDIDTDFPDIYREKVIEYVKERYGNKRVSGIITYGTLATKLVIRDVGRVLNVPIKSIDVLCGCIPNITKLKISEFYRNNEKFRNTIDSSDKLTLLYNICSLIEGFPRHTSTHAAGIVMSRIDLDNIIPLSKSDNMYVSGYTMEHLEKLGLLKMDFLGIKNLTVIMNIISDIEKYENINIDFSKIELDDNDAIKIFTEANTCGIFQFESEGMKKFLRKLKPTSLDDIFAAIALFRPGPAVNIDSYIRRKHNEEKIEYLDNSLEEILSSTYGIIVYQEQIMQIANKMAGFSYGEADILRRAMSKKKLDILENEEEKFINGCVNNGYSLDVSKKIYDLILNFANYGFNKSHSVCYSIIAYKMAYLKAHYPKYFFKNILSGVIGNESKTIEYINEARGLGINILLPDINKSTNVYEVCDEGLVFPLSCIKNLGIVTCKDMVSSRCNKYVDIYDCFSKIISKNVNKSVLESLIFSSCFNSFGYNKKTLINNIDNLLNYSFLSKDLDSNYITKPVIEIFDEYSKEELLIKEKECFGFYFSNHPTELFKSRIDYEYVDLKNINLYFNKNIKVIGLIDRIKSINTKNNEKMAFVSISDNTGDVDLTIFPEEYKKYDQLNVGSIISVNGVVQRRFDKYQIVVKKID